MPSGCCGQRIPTLKKETAPLPENPDVGSGVKLLYLGAGRRDFEGPSGLTYVVSDQRRRFVVDAQDVPRLLKERFVIEQP